MLSALATSCIDDNSTYGGYQLPELSISLPADESMPVYNFPYGEECVLDPEISYTGDGDLKYEWSIGTYDGGVKGPGEVVSNEKILRHFFPKGGAYYAHLVVSDGSVGLVQDFMLSINRTFEQGYLVISNNSNNEGNLVFIKDLTREESEAGIPQTILENCLQRVNPDLGKAMLVGAIHIQWYAWNPVTFRPTLTNRLVVVTADEGLYLDANTFVASSSIIYDDIVPGFKGDDFFLSGTSPMVLDASSKKYITFDSENMFGYEDSKWKGNFFDFVKSYTYMSGSNQTTTSYFANLKPLAFFNNSAYYGWSSTADIIDSNGNNLFSNDELIVVFKGEGVLNQWDMLDYPCYVISRDKSTGELYMASLGGFGPYSTGITLNSHVNMAVKESTAIPQVQSHIVASDLYHRTYFYNGNKLYVMLFNNGTCTLPLESQFSISFPENEEVTFITINTDPDNNSSTQGEDLIIATADKSTGRGNIYIYDVKDVRTDNPNPAPKATYKNCADRIKNIMYKPRIS